jgi:hypothetical protein
MFKIALISLSLLMGCSTKVLVIHSDSDLVRLGPDVSGHIYTRNRNGVWVKSGNKVLLPEGWYAGPFNP